MMKRKCEIRFVLSLVGVSVLIILSGCGQHRSAKVIQALGPVARGDGVHEATPYNPQETMSSKLVILESGEGRRLPDWNDLLPEDWLPSSVGETALVVILYDNWLVVGTKQYCSAERGCENVSRQAHEMDIVIREAVSGRILLTGTLKGPLPRQFPERLGQDTTEIRGAPVGYLDFENWLRSAMLDGLEAPSDCNEHGSASSPDTNSETTREKDCMELVHVPEGEFTMGLQAGKRRDETPEHQVYLDAFYIDKFEVSNAKYAWCVAAGACSRPARTDSYTRDTYYGDRRYMDYPVLNVPWSQAQAYCAWVGGRLPTEAEWEKAASGTGRGLYPWGAATPTRRLANFDDIEGDTTRVGSYPDGASPYGVLDMAGNAWEWVADWHAEDYYARSPASNPTGPATGVHRVVRGGSWSTDSSWLSTSKRGHENPTVGWVQGGFRCATAP